MAARPTLLDVAQRAGVSTALASYALNGTGRVAASTVERVLAAARDLDYHADARARSLRTGRSTVYGVIIRNMRNPFFLNVLRGMEMRAEEDEASLLIINSAYDPAREAAALRRLTAEGVGGIAIAPIGRKGPLAEWAAAHSSLPVVAFNRTPDPADRATSARVPTVGPDDPSAVQLAVGHLRERGHRSAILVAAPTELAADWGREAEFIRLCGEWNMEGRIIRCPLDHESVSRAVARSLRGAAHQAFVVNSDYLAAAIYDAAHSCGKRIGCDVSVIGHDDLATSALLAPGLTTIAFDQERLGRQIMTMLLDARSEPRDIRLPVRLVARDSVADLRAP
ncbi:LacI family DNA-binding transcriptional regulator [Sinomonas sp. ASV322]|uniref:LacI family DNA-binding transcriptional regulator n=1 Tax=Sinomonas sp. ASV322 TaxID=3041920 RepID=UPI0027DC3528|nr:LacI family DNA-binding transcriptional regulator [Sinomonas sp. ASV322]MDQ4501037.1 LacI family DNA-binding transcriptional regulator [Sinomonas sp. ASV322]